MLDWHYGMLALGIIAVLAGLFLILTDLYIRRDLRRKQQAALVHENDDLWSRLHAIESQLPQALVMMDGRGMLRRVNPAAERLFGYNENELVGNNIRRLLPFAPAAPNLAGAPLVPDEAQGAEMEVRRKDHSSIRVRMTGARFDATGPANVYMFFEAVTAGPPEPPLELVERVVGRITAKFEELLTTINGYGQLALYDAPETGPLRQQLEEIVGASEEASHLTRNLLAFSGNQLIPVEPVDLNAVVLSAIRQFVGSVDSDLAPDPPLALGNRECLLQVIAAVMNCTANQADEEQPRIHIATSQRTLERPLRVYSGELTPGTYGVIDISNERARLSAEVLAHLFEPMYRNPGLWHADLSAIYGMVVSLGGRLHVESSEAGGTVFEIWLPSGSGRSLTDGTVSQGAVA